jgi:hypothetical protein
MDIAPGEKKCNRCEKIKLEEEFNKDKQKKDGLRNYCKECEKIQYAEKKKKKELGQVKEFIPQIMEEATLPPEIPNKKELDVSVDSLSIAIAKQYGDDIQKADEIYDLFYNRIASGDNTQASKEALTKSLELRMAAGDNISKLIQIAAKLQEAREKNKGKGAGGINMDNIRKNFGLD